MNNENIITDDKKNVEIMNDYFVNITKNLIIPEIRTDNLPENIDMSFIDSIDQIIQHYRNHPSIHKINGEVNLTERFLFHIVNEAQIENRIFELNSKKSAGYDNSPPRVIKDCVRVITSPH